MSLTKPTTLSFTRSKFNAGGFAIPQEDLRYIVIVDGIFGLTEHVATLVGGSQASLPLADELPDIGGDYEVQLVAKNIINGQISADSVALTVTVIDDQDFAPDAPADLLAS